MNFTYYKILEKIKEKDDAFNKIKKAGIINLILFILGGGSSGFGLWKESIIIYFIGVFIILIGLFRVLRVKTDFSAQDDHIDEIKKIIEDAGLKTESKIEYLREQIKKENEKSEIKVKNFYRAISVVFIFCFWVPSGYILKFYYEQNPEILKDVTKLSDIMALNIQGTIILIGLLIVVFPLMGNFLRFGKANRDRIDSYLCEILLKYYK